MRNTPTPLCPFVERNIAEEHFTHSFSTLLATELAHQSAQVKQKKRKHIQIDLNKLYAWQTISQHTDKLLRNLLFSADLNPMIEGDILRGDTTELIRLAHYEYVHQRKAVKQGRRKHIQVSYNLLYC
jgi:hypothetical protein